MIMALVLSILSLSLSVFIFIYYLINFKKRLSEIEYPYEVEERILELLGKFKHVASIKLEMLEKKIEELRGLIKEANDMYAALNVSLADMSKVKDELKNDSIDISSNSKDRKQMNESEQPSKAVENGETNDKQNEPVSKSLEEAFKNSNEKVDEFDEEDNGESLERKILRLNDEGIKDLDIARRLGLGVGEVRLIIELFKGQKRG
ncbi:MAG: hypothetical protein J7K69_06545 [Thermotogae bacterium]|nr:hypothetical protein [Thermotogota bacterium]